MNDKPDSDRRNFLIGAVVGGAAGAAGTDIWKGLGNLTKRVFGEDQETCQTCGLPPTVPEDWKEIIRNLTGENWIDFNRDTTHLVGQAHPRYRYQESPSMAAAVAPFHSTYLDFFLKREIADEVSMGQVNGDVITFGSPSSNALMQHLLGFEQQGSNSLDLRNVPTGRDFPFTMDLSCNHPPVIRTSHKKKYVEPAWSITDRSGNVFTPRTRGDGQIASDFLLITRLPNPQLPGHYILNFAGLHGAGTSSVRLLLHDPRKFVALDSKISAIDKAHDGAWQALIPVPVVKISAGNNMAREIDIEGTEVAAIE